MNLWYLNIVIFLLYQVNLSSQQVNQRCNLPNGGQSTCQRLHHCDPLWSMIKPYGSNPPKHIADHVRSHVCGQNNLVCCPIEEVPVTTTQNNLVSPTQYNQVPPTPSTPLILIGDFNEINCGISSSDRVMGGENAALMEIPWAVLLGYKEAFDGPMEWKCGGTLITRRFVFTAAHCIVSGLHTARLGEHTISTLQDCVTENGQQICADPVQDIEIETRSTLKHPQYNRRFKFNDIALLKLKSLADTTKNNVNTVCLPMVDKVNLQSVIDSSQGLIISGWGTKGDGAANSDVLQKASIPFVSNEECELKYRAINYQVRETHLCAGGDLTKTKTDVCFGDSGGSITAMSVLDGRPKVFLYGVVQGGVACNSNINLPGLYTNIDSFFPWFIFKIMHN